MSTLLNKPIQQKCQQGVGRWSKKPKAGQRSLRMTPYLHDRFTRFQEYLYMYLCMLVSKYLHTVHFFDKSLKFDVVFSKDIHK